MPEAKQGERERILELQIELFKLQKPANFIYESNA